MLINNGLKMVKLLANFCGMRRIKHFGKCCYHHHPVIDYFPITVTDNSPFHWNISASLCSAVSHLTAASSFILHRRFFFLSLPPEGKWSFRDWLWCVMWDVGQNSWFRTSAPPQQVPGDVTQLKRQERRDRESEGEIIQERHRTWLWYPMENP